MSDIGITREQFLKVMLEDPPPPYQCKNCGGVHPLKPIVITRWQAEILGLDPGKPSCDFILTELMP